MENKKKNNAVKTVLMVFGIIFSIVLIPGLIVGIPAGGAAIGFSSMASQDSLVRIVEEAKLAEQVLERVEDEVVAEVRTDELKSEYVQSLTEDLITVEWVDSVISEVLNALYFGRTPNVKLDSVVKTLTDRLEELTTNGFGDIYSAWRNGTPSVYFTDSFVQSFIDTLEEEILAEYKQLGAVSLDELEQKYDAVYGAGSFSKLVDEKAQSYQTKWDEEINRTLDELLEGAITTAEEEVNKALTELAQNEDICKAFDYLKEIEAKASLLKMVVYGVIFGAVLLLVSCFWFGTAGFVVSAVPLAIGGGICKLAANGKEPLLDYVDKFIAKEPELSEFGGVVNSMVNSVVTPVLTEVSKLGNTVLIAAVVLLGLAIMSGVLRKNKSGQDVGNVEG